MGSSHGRKYGTLARALTMACGAAACVVAVAWADPGDGAGRAQPLAAAGQPADPAVAQPSVDQIRAMMAAGGKPSGGDDEDSKLKPFAEVSKGYEKVVSTTDGQSLYSLWTRAKDGQMLAELPRGYENQKHFIALTVASGEDYAGLQAGDMYVYWKRRDNRLLMMEPQIGTRSTGDQESKSSIKRLYTDRVVIDVPILAMGPNGQPVIDMDELLASRAGTFFGPGVRGANAGLANIKTAKAFPENVEIAFEMPTAGGFLQTFHYSISQIRDNTGYQPRAADERVGYFTTVYRDLGKFTDQDKWVRYINRWHVEKKDPRLKLSPPKEPIVFYVEHTVPVRYRRWVREGALYWNVAFEKIGIKDAIEVYYQDEETGANMEKDPEDVRYNFLRWLSNDQGTAIGPSRVHPLTGQILDADVILTDGWIRHFWLNYNQVLPEMAMEGFGPETMAWLESRPQWDPRIRLAEPLDRDRMMAERMQHGLLKYGGHPIAMAMSPDGAGNMVGGTEWDGIVRRQSQRSGLCLAAQGKAFDVATMRMALEIMGDALEQAATASEPDDEAEVQKMLEQLPPELRKQVEDQIKSAGGIAKMKEKMPAEMREKLAKGGEPKDEDKKDDKGDKKDEKKKDQKWDTLDGIPDWFVGPLLADLVTHEVGHTLGLRHNFKASSIYTLSEINSTQVKGKAFTGSVMDYTPININMGDGPIQGDFGMTGVGAYDMWAIEYGYTLEDPKEVVKRVAEKDLRYATDEDTFGPDPLARRYDFSANPLDYAKSQMKLAKYHRERLLSKFVKDGESWSKARKGYELTLGLQTRGLSMMANWVGGAYVNRDRKGDPNARNPVEIVPAGTQRDALKWVIDNSFFDDSFGLTPELRDKMTVDKWMDQGGFQDAMQDATWPIHDRIAGIQSSVMTMLMNPTRLKRVFDNEFGVPADQDALTLPEMIDTITVAVWKELDAAPEGNYSNRKPMISSLRRNLQREYVERMIDLTLPGGVSGEAGKPISNLAVAKLRQLKDKLAKASETSGLDTYTQAHLSEAKIRIDKALDAQFIYNSGGAGGVPYWLFGRPTEQAPQQHEQP
ncbi:MAG: zinc-dependent metalloprotease [Phycisphaerales bacterium]|nr:zinc-dependent metalloprotease [Phycisphaerales bacterium]